MPTQFAFGSVQLVLNMWFCAPRAIHFGYTDKQHIANRTKGIWAVSSIGLLLTMPIVFIEMIGCDTFLKAVGGHVWYDLAVGLLGVGLSVAAFADDHDNEDDAIKSQ